MRSRGQALVEAALVMPILMFAFLGMGEAAFLTSAHVDQQRATGELADWIVANPGADWDPPAIDIGLGDCLVAVTEAGGLVRVGATCTYHPVITSNIWNGLQISTEAQAASTPMPTPSPSGDTSSETAPPTEAP